MIPTDADDIERERFERRVQDHLDVERARREARRQLDAEERGPIAVLPPFETLRDLLARPRLATVFRIEGFLPVGSRVMFTAQAKTGKTTVVSNLIQSLTDGDAFLGRYAVAPVDGTIALVDFEMSDAQLGAWLRARGIRHDDRVFVQALRGHAAAFDILNPKVRARWVAIFQTNRVAFLILDCLRPILDALGLDEHKDVGRFLVALDMLLVEAGIGEALIVHHMGHTTERARGDSRLRDWPDCEWRLVRQNDDPASARFITAYGRDVDVPESRLLYDPATRALTITDGSRKDTAARHALAALIAVLDAAPDPLSGQSLKKALMGEHARDIVDHALRAGVKTKQLTVHDGPRNARLYAVPARSPNLLSIRASGRAGAPGSRGVQPSGSELAPGSKGFRASGSFRPASQEAARTSFRRPIESRKLGGSHKSKNKGAQHPEARSTSLPASKPLTKTHARPDGNVRSPTPQASGAPRTRSSPRGRRAVKV